MPALLAPALLHLALGAGLALSHEVGLRAEGRAHRLRLAAGELETFDALDLQPQGRLTIESRTAALELAYAPVFTHQWGDRPDRDTWLHLASASARWRSSPAWQLHADGRFTRGVADLFSRAGTTAAPGQPPAEAAAPVASTVGYLRSEVALGAEGELGPRLRLGTAAEASREGGLDREARDVVPLQQTGRARAELGWLATRTTTLAGWTSGEITRYFDVRVADPAAPGGATFRSWSIWAGRLGGAWRQALGREGRAWVILGAAVAGGDGPGQPGRRLRPTGELGLGRSPEAASRRPRLELSLAAAPTGDRTTGLVSTRADLRAWLAWDPAERWALTAAGGAGRVLDGPTERDAFATGELRLGWEATDWLRLVAGGRFTGQRTPRLGPGSTTEWVAFGALELVRRGRP